MGIDPLVARKAIPKHKGILSEELLISVVLNATEDEMTWLDADHFIIEVMRRKGGGMLRFLFGFMINNGGITFTGFMSWRLVGEASFKCW